MKQIDTADKMMHFWWMVGIITAIGEKASWWSRSENTIDYEEPF